MSFDYFTKEHNTIYQNVLWLIKKYPETRENYAVLVAYYHYYVNNLQRWMPLQVLQGLTSPESITRSFRKVLEHNPSLQPSAKTRKQRDEQVERYRRHYGRKDKGYKIE